MPPWENCARHAEETKPSKYPKYLEKETLATSYKERKEQLAKEQKELAENPPQPEDLEIIFWHNDSSR